MFYMEVTGVIFDRNSIVYIQMYLLNQFRKFLTSLRLTETDQQFVNTTG